MRELIVTPERLIRERRPGEERAKTLLIYDLEGELFFGAAPQFHRFLEQIIEETDRTGIKYVVLRLKRTWNPDVVVVEHLERFLHDAEERGITSFLAGVRPQFLRILENVHLTDWFPADRIFPEEDETFSATLRAVRRAFQLADAQAIGALHDRDHVPEILDQDREPVYIISFSPSTGKRSSAIRRRCDTARVIES